MTEQEAIQVFKELLDVPKEMLVRHEYALYEEQKEKINKVYLAEQMAIKALEKQIPKKPTIESQCDGNAFSDWNRWYCPVCHNSLGVTNHPRKDDYCDECGQKLDWRDEE